jgi:hypothetical protein
MNLLWLSEKKENIERELATNRLYRGRIHYSESDRQWEHSLRVAGEIAGDDGLVLEIFAQRNPDLGNLSQLNELRLGCPGSLVVIIHDFHMTSAKGMAIFLQQYREEPRPNIFFILNTDNLDKIPITVQGICAKFRVE